MRKLIFFGSFLLLLLVSGCRTALPESTGEPGSLPEEVYRRAAILARTIAYLHQHYPDADKVTYEKLFDHALRGVAAGLDVYSGYEAPEQYRANSVLRTGMDQGKTVIAAVPDSAAVRLDGGIGYVKVGSFTDHTASELAGALKKLTEEKPPLSGLILDLRGNPGGRIGAALESAALFLPPGTVLAETTNREKHSQLVTSEKLPSLHFPDLPLAILTDRRTASAAELLAGGLRYCGRAKIFGEKTFGKGTLLRVIELPGGGALRTASAFYRFPDGKKIEGVGVMPDVPVSSGKAKDAALEYLQNKHCRKNI